MSSIDSSTRTSLANEDVSFETLSSWRLTRLTWSEMTSLYLPVLKKTFGWLLILQVIQVIASQLSADAMDSIRIAGREDLTSIALIAVFELVFTLVWTALWIVVIALAANRVQNPLAQRSVRFLSTMNQILIEQTRVLAAVIWRIPLILPAAIQWVRLELVPFIVLFDPNYEVGNRDALTQSRTLSTRRFWLLFLYLLIVAVAAWLIDDIVKADGEGLWDAPVRTLLAGLINAFVSLGGALFLYSLYRQLAANDSANDPASDTVDLASRP